MALSAALVDRARVYSRQPLAGVRVEGRTQTVEAASEWIKARLTLPAGPEAADSGPRSRRRAVRAPSLMLAPKDLDRIAVDVTTDTKIGVTSKQQFSGERIFQVTGDPEPIRKKRKVIGFTVALRSVEDHPLEPIAGAS